MAGPANKTPTKLASFLAGVKAPADVVLGIDVAEKHSSGLRSTLCRVDLPASTLKDGTATFAVLRAIAASECSTETAFVVRVEGHPKEHEVRLRE